MSRALLLLLFGFTCLAPLQAQDANETTDSPPVELPAMRVNSEWFKVDCYWGADGKLVQVKVRDVTPTSPAQKCGIRRHDLLHAIDATPIKGLTALEFERLFKREATAEAPKVFTFVAERGFFTKRKVLLRLGLAPRAH